MGLDTWDQWRLLTRFTESGRMAFAREAELWGRLELAHKDDAKIHAPAGQGLYEVSLQDHLLAVEDLSPLLSSVLIHSYALAESAAADHLGIAASDFGGIEDWGSQLLDRNQRTWQQVLDGKPGAVEVAVCRNAYAHGDLEIGHKAAKRLLIAGSVRWAQGDGVEITYDELRLYRDRLRSLLRLGGVRRTE